MAGLSSLFRCDVVAFSVTRISVRHSIHVGIRLGMSIWANVFKMARACRVAARIPFVALGMVNYLLSRMCVATVNASRTNIHETVSVCLKRNDAGAKHWFVFVDEGIATKPASVYFKVSKHAERVIMVVAFGAPRSMELGKSFGVHPNISVILSWSHKLEVSLC